MDADDLSGQLLDGRYQVIEQIGEGAMGHVYRAERVKLGRAVAIKVMNERLPDEMSARKRFEREAMSMAKLEHPHCASVLDIGVHDKSAPMSRDHPTVHEDRPDREWIFRGEHPRPMLLVAFLDDLEAAFNVLAIQREVSFLVRRDPSLPEEVIWDQDRINEVLGNLLSNAFKFTNRGGGVELDARAEGDAVHIRVHDTGAGIPHSQLPHIFQKFYQADNQSQASAKGTGLGLAIAKEIVEAHKGTITVESVAGEGTTFELSLPVRVASPRRTAQVHALTADGVTG